MNILFVCKLGLQRSPTAAGLVNDAGEHDAKFAGVSENAEVPITKAVLDWADKIIVMEPDYKEIIQNNFKTDRDIEVLNVDDIFFMNDPELVNILKEKLAKYLK